ncbi:AbrB family transcriptional regulator [Sporolactobacillus shoreae]|uniref:AbrB family transcriptional regulator n=1 Tax=Sporolactobacillus shoreae TaxID=1465501 RepID=A0A4Z0GS12_9BACL|nr:AbrB/MazE/SpoVT family DNA-binding domain-containing protein [Sporolactobacillus shoreae]TGA98971.1 AbrB family transcriptional regulator [Sporolactobacillus shoreae]
MGSVNVQRKIFKMGNSYGSTYPIEVLEHLNAKPGDQVEFKLQADGTVTIKKKNNVQLPDGIDPELIKTVTGVMNQYDRAIKELAKK